jgi:membrane protease YdiL (CAAX protease family)
MVDVASRVWVLDVIWPALATVLAGIYWRDTWRFRRLCAAYLAVMTPWLLMALFECLRAGRYRYAMFEAGWYILPVSAVAVARTWSGKLKWPYLRVVRALLRRRRIDFPLWLVLSVVCLHEHWHSAWVDAVRSTGIQVRILSTADASWLHAVTTAVREEVLYRGLLLTGLSLLFRRWSIGPWLAILLSSALWGCMHYGYTDPAWVRIIGTAAFGVILGWLRMRWGMEASLLVHVLVNGGYNRFPLPLRLLLIALTLGFRFNAQRRERQEEDATRMPELAL